MMQGQPMPGQPVMYAPPPAQARVYAQPRFAPTVTQEMRIRAGMQAPQQVVTDTPWTGAVRKAQPEAAPDSTGNIVRLVAAILRSRCSCVRADRPRRVGRAELRGAPVRTHRSLCRPVARHHRLCALARSLEAAAEAAFGHLSPLGCRRRGYPHPCLLHRRRDSARPRRHPRRAQPCRNGHSRLRSSKKR
jgi:hypothetical protein